MPRIVREHLRDKCSGGIGRNAATGSSKGAVLFFFGSYAGRRAGRPRVGYPATPAAGGRPHRGIRRHLPPDAARIGNPANDGMPKAGPDGPVRGNRSVGSGRYGWAGIRPAASRGTVGGASGRRRKPYDRQLRVSGGESANAPAEGATAGTVPPFVRRDRNTLSTARADNTSSRNESRPFRNPPRRGGMPAAGVAYRGPLARGFCLNQEILQSRRSSMP